MTDLPDVTAHLHGCGPDLNSVIAGRLHAALLDAEIAKMSAPPTCVCCGSASPDGESRSDGWYCAGCIYSGWDQRGL